MRHISYIFEAKVLVALLLVGIVAVGAGFKIAEATLVNSSGVIPAPDVIADDTPGATNDRQQAFDEAQEVTLPVDVRCDRTILAAGDTVNSHMIFFNTPFTGISEDLNRTWTFEEEILCVMSNSNGLYQADTDRLLGAAGTDYPGPFIGRGLENNDSYVVDGNQITVSMTAEEPGDWIRILTQWTPPADDNPPVVYCAPTVNPAGNDPKKSDKSQGGNFFELIGSDDSDGPVDIYLIDPVSGTEFGPFESGTTIKQNVAKGAPPSQEALEGEINYSIKTQGTLEISATDSNGNEASAVCE